MSTGADKVMVDFFVFSFHGFPGRIREASITNTHTLASPPFFTAGMGRSILSGLGGVSDDDQSSEACYARRMDTWPCHVTGCALRLGTYRTVTLSVDDPQEPQEHSTSLSQDSPAQVVRWCLCDDCATRVATVAEVAGVK
jgi:hypothetical protein